jgi:hypothetical protein
MLYEIDLRMFKNVYKSSTKIFQIGSCGKFQPHWLHVRLFLFCTYSCSMVIKSCPLLVNYTETCVGSILASYFNALIPKMKREFCTLISSSWVHCLGITLYIGIHFTSFPFLFQSCFLAQLVKCQLSFCLHLVSVIVDEMDKIIKSLSQSDIVNFPFICSNIPATPAVDIIFPIMVSLRESWC